MTSKPISPNATDPRRVRLDGTANTVAVPSAIRDTGIVRLGGYLPSN